MGLHLLRIKMPLNVCDEFAESAVIDFEMIQDRMVDISLSRLHASLLKTIEKGVKASKDLVEIMRESVWGVFFARASLANAIRPQEADVPLYPLEIFHEIHQIFFLPLSGAH